MLPIEKASFALDPVKEPQLESMEIWVNCMGG